MPELILCRHGQTDYNLQGRVQGRVDVALNAVGRAQAKTVAPILARLAPCRIISSPLQRARATANCVAQLTGLTVEIDPDLVERSFGQWEGLPREQMQRDWPEQYALWVQGKDPLGVDVEPRAAAAARVGAALRRAAMGSAPGAVLVVSHGAAISLGTTWLLGLDPTNWFGLRGMDNCGYARLRQGTRAPGWVLEQWNVTHDG